jgi:hypothetical protein
MSGFAVEAEVLDALRRCLPAVAERTVTAVIAEVPQYVDAFHGDRGTIETAVAMALGGFLRLAGQAGDSSPLGPTRDAAYALGRGEARSGRTMDALLSAYRTGARVAWREMSQTAVDSGLAASTVAEFAELVFAYIDELSAASVAGHGDELATSGRVRQQYLQRLGHALLTGAAEDALVALAERADWTPVPDLTVVLLPSAQSRTVLSHLDPRAISVPGDLVQIDRTDVLLAADARPLLIRSMRGTRAVVGPTRPWTAARTSFLRASRLATLGLADEPLDTEAHLAELVLHADPEALDDLRAKMLLPLAELPPATAERLAETLRSWLLHQGRRDEVAADLHVHAQTVRYRMTQLRDLYGQRLTDADVVLQLTIALAPRRGTRG